MANIIPPPIPSDRSSKPPKGAGLVDYLREAFLFRWNLLFFLGGLAGAAIAPIPDVTIPLVVAGALSAIPDPLINEAVAVTALAGITGSASGGMSIALAAMAESFIANANAAGIPMEVLHRVAAMASGGMDTLPHNGAVITLLAVTGLTHRQAYKDIFAITLIKTLAVFVVIGVFYLTGWV